MANSLEKLYDLKKKYDHADTDDDDDVVPDTPLDWYLLSLSDTITYNAIKKYHKKLSLDRIVINPKISFRKKVSDDYGAEINWNKVAMSMVYRINKNKLYSDSDRTDTYQMLKDHIDHVKWDNVFNGHSHEMIDDNFLIYFMYDIDWNVLLKVKADAVSKSTIRMADEKQLINWDTLSDSSELSSNFMQKFKDRINWDIYIKTHEPYMIPVMCRNMEEILIAVKNDPTYMAMLGNKSIASELSEKLRKYNWIDRVAGFDGHYQDDTGLWYDSVGDGDDQLNYESDRNDGLYNEEKHLRDNYELVDSDEKKIYDIDGSTPSSSWDEENLEL